MATQRDRRIGVAQAARLLTRTFGYMGSQRRDYLIGWALSGAELATAYLTPYLYKQLVLLVGEQDGGVLSRVIGLFVLMVLLAPAITLGWYLKRRSTAYGAGQMRKAVFAHIQRLPMGTLARYTQGDFITRLTGDITGAANVFNAYAVTGLVKFVLYTSISLTVVFIGDWRMGLAAAALCALGCYLSVIINPRVRYLELDAREQTAQSTSLLMETLRAMPIVRVFLLAPRLTERYRAVCARAAKGRIRSLTLNGLAEGVVFGVGFLMQPVGLLLGILLMIRGEMPLSQVVFLSGVMGVMNEGLRGFFLFSQYIQNSLVAARRVFAVLDEAVEADLPSGEGAGGAIPATCAQDADSQAVGRAIQVVDGCAVRLTGVRFGYQPDRPVLNGLDMSAQAGSYVALVGASGSGKSTILKLIEGLYAPETGRVTVLGRDVRQVSPAWLRAQIAYVSQEGGVYDGTIAENIAFGRPGATRAQIEQAARRAQLEPFIASLPNGYDTPVGERAAQISGGQRQRIAIARAMLRDAPILLLDEPTNALDTDTEQAVSRALAELMTGKTAIVVAHRLSTVVHADRICVVEGGRVVESGSHEALLRRDGRYRQLVQRGLK